MCVCFGILNAVLTLILRLFAVKYGDVVVDGFEGEVSRLICRGAEQREAYDTYSLRNINIDNIALSYGCFDYAVKSAVLTEDCVIIELNSALILAVTDESCLGEVDVVAAAVHKNACRIRTVLLSTVTNLSLEVRAPGEDLTFVIEYDCVSA